jgi:hypothetical protein
MSIILRPPQRAQAAIRLLKSRGTEFEDFLAWLKAEREDAVKTLSVCRDSVSTGHYQGCVQTIDELLRHAESDRR